MFFTTDFSPLLQNWGWKIWKWMEGLLHIKNYHQICAKAHPDGHVLDFDFLYAGHFNQATPNLTRNLSSANLGNFSLQYTFISAILREASAARSGELLQYNIALHIQGSSCLWQNKNAELNFQFGKKRGTCQQTK